MSIRIVRLGTPRTRGEGVRLGTVRRPPRGVRKADYARRDYYDAWLPELAPSAAVVSAAMARSGTRPVAGAHPGLSPRDAEPGARHLIAALAALSHQADFSVGCYCADEATCHRSLLRGLLLDAGARVAGEGKRRKEEP